MPTSYRTANPVPVQAVPVADNPFVPDAIENLDDAVGRAGAWASNRDNWIRVLKVVAGGALLIVGVGQLVVKPVAAGAAAVAPVGKVVKAAGKVVG